MHVLYINIGVLVSEGSKVLREGIVQSSHVRDVAMSWDTDLQPLGVQRTEGKHM